MFDVKRVLFIGAHTDDEMVCAGTLHRFGQENTEVSVLTFSPAGIDTDRCGLSVDSEHVVKPEWEAALDAIGVTNRNYYGLLPSPRIKRDRQEICQQISTAVGCYNPDLAIILSPNDSHQEHATVGQECEAVLRGRVAHVWRCIFPWNYVGDRPNLYMTLDRDDLEVKRQVIRCYRSQVFRYDYEEVLINYARADGLAVKAYAAERFELVRGVL